MGIRPSCQVLAKCQKPPVTLLLIFREKGMDWTLILLGLGPNPKNILILYSFPGVKAKKLL
jgi:hypothetical protein